MARSKPEARVDIRLGIWEAGSSMQAKTTTQLTNPTPTKVHGEIDVFLHALGRHRILIRLHHYE
jgi:hypothetical protein